MKQFSVILIGAGNRGTTYCSYMNNMPDKYKIVGIAEPDSFRRMEAAKNWNVPSENCFADWREILSRPKFADIAVKGLTTIMKLYPNTVRATSETEEMCRLVFPLALLYEYTGKEEHYEWLHRVVKDLEKVKHPSGGYAEWDTGYKARRSRKEGDECSLLANNGDPVADLLYANNWLPLGFAYAYMVSKEEYFHKKWEEIATFLLRCQMHSDDKLLDGAWTRAMDLNRMESYGVPHDIGWAPCCIETGWTVAEILMGLQFMAIAEKHI